ncbi:MAG: hypothetical protein NVS1B14_07890 [Vulcanimicrobiaceae bacterium]
MRYVIFACLAPVLALALASCGPKPGAPTAPSVATSPGTRYAYVVVPAAPPSPAPKILEIALNAQRYSAPGTVDVRVRTTDDVTLLTAKLLGRERAIPKIAAGLFADLQALPDVPFFLKGHDYTVEFVATTDDGRRTAANVTVHLNR